ncbi:hypothetical protein HDV04_003715 [Boothiomyces sp. JEL0838]|nr:hypothetical protein HDV04_003715 [Boothiomyces sp. JEL0838]
MIRSARLEDAEQIVSIYNYYIKNTIITFEEELVKVEEMEDRISKIQSEFPWIVYEQDGKILGYAYASTFRTRYAYRFTVESTVYLDHTASGKGIGSILYTDLIEKVKDLGKKAVIGGVSLPNEKSVKLHEKCGFVYVGTFPKVGYKFEKWIDVAFYQLNL